MQGGSWEVAQPCRSRADCWKELAQVPLRALPCHHPWYLVCNPLRSSLLWQPPPAASDRQGPSTRLYLHAVPEHMGEEPLAHLPQNLLFLHPGLRLHCSKADHGHRQPNLQGVRGAVEVAEPTSAMRTLTSSTV